MYKMDPPGGWRLLDDYHSPAETARYVQEQGDGWYAVVDVVGYGMDDYEVHQSVERGILKNTSGHDRPYHDTEVRSSSVVVSGVSEQRAFDEAKKVMLSGGKTGAGLFDDLGW
jgi:hypothetical protein